MLRRPRPNDALLSVTGIVNHQSRPNSRTSMGGRHLPSLPVLPNTGRLPVTGGWL